MFYAEVINDEVTERVNKCMRKGNETLDQTANLLNMIDELKDEEYQEAIIEFTELLYQTKGLIITCTNSLDVRLEIKSWEDLASDLVDAFLHPKKFEENMQAVFSGWEDNDFEEAGRATAEAISFVKVVPMPHEHEMAQESKETISNSPNSSALTQQSATKL